MTTSRTALIGNPFAILLDPSAVIAACQKSEKLGALRRAVHRPLDKPKVFLDTETAEYDAAVDAGGAVPPIVKKKPPAAAPTAVSVYAAESLAGVELVLEGGEL